MVVVHHAANIAISKKTHQITLSVFFLVCGDSTTMKDYMYDRACVLVWVCMCVVKHRINKLSPIASKGAYHLCTTYRSYLCFFDRNWNIPECHAKTF